MMDDKGLAKNDVHLAAERKREKGEIKPGTRDSGRSGGSGTSPLPAHS